MSTLWLAAVLSVVSQTPTTPEPPRLDASSEVALEASILRMVKSLPPNDWDGWNAHPLSLALDSLGNTEGMAERDRAAEAQGKRPERVPVLKHLDGMTYQQIIAAWHAQEMRRRLEWKAKNVRAMAPPIAPPLPPYPNGSYSGPRSPYPTNAYSTNAYPTNSSR